jgi:hypothetical protein
MNKDLITLFYKLTILLEESELSYVEMIGALEVMKTKLVNEMGAEDDDEEDDDEEA